jgi:hypothetical protein
MSQLHKINQASIEFDFTEQTDAEIFEQRAPQWVVQQLLPVIETVFDEVCPEHQTLIIDSLTLDLGELNPQTFYQQAPEKLKQVLQDQLRWQLYQVTQSHTPLWGTDPTPRGTHAKPEPTTNMVVLNQEQQRWEVLWQFLSTGLLPWSVPGEQSLENLGLSNVLTEHSAQLINALNSTSQHEQILRRVIEQFPLTSIANLFESLTPALQWQIMSLLLAHPKSHARELSHSLKQAWYRRFTQLLAQHNLAALRGDWEALIHQFAPQLIQALYQRNTDSQLPWNLLRDLNDTQRLLLLSVLTPQEYPFLSAILSAPDWWQMDSLPSISHSMHHATQELNPSQSIKLLPQSQIHQHLWIFTLHYLLIDRGSAFNRQSYMSGLIVHMANSQNQTVEALLETLIAALNSTTLDSTLRTQLQDLLQHIQPIIVSPALLKTHIQPETGNPPFPETFLPEAKITQPAIENASKPVSSTQLHHINELVIALCSGQENQLKQYWPTNLQSFAALLRWCGQLEYVRRHWSETYSEQTLLAFVEALDPVATTLIRILIAEKHLFAQHQSTTATASDERTTGIHLWKLTFAFLIVERGSEFNRKSYLRYLIQQMAARRNTSYAVLLEIMCHHLAIARDLSLSGVTIRTLLEDLRSASGAKKLSQRAEQPHTLYWASLAPSLIEPVSFAQLTEIKKIITTLQNADLNQWSSNITQWQRDYSKPLPLIIRQLGSTAATLRLWVNNFNELALLKITAIINPDAKKAVHTLINESQTINAAVRHASSPQHSTNSRNALWELTLHYLISRRGSEFNQYQYLLSMTGQLSARYRIKTSVLIREWLTLCNSAFLWRQQLIDLVAYDDHSPVTAPQLLKNIQSATNAPVFSQQQRDLLRQYATINASAVAIQLQTWHTTQLARLVRIMQPQLNDSVIDLLPLLLSIIQHFKLAAHWFYPLLLSHDCPATPEQWLQRLLHQINKHNASLGVERYLQLQQCILSSHAIHHNLAERKRWLYRITPVEALLEGLAQWLEGEAPAPEQALLSYLVRDYPQALWHWLQRTLSHSHYLQRWLNGLSPQIHRELLLPTVSNRTMALLELRHAYCQLFGSNKQGEQLFWQTLYRQYLLKGIAIDSSQLMQYVLIELNQSWGTFAHQGKTSSHPSVAELIAHLLPWISSASLRKTLGQINSLSEIAPSSEPSWTEQLNYLQPEIKQLIDAIEIPNKTIPQSTKIPWKEPQDKTEENSEPVTIYNAGLVIASSYIPMLFQRLALTNGQQFVDIQAQHQALFCLQWMTNHTDNAPEYQLLLNKVLCGIASSEPIPQQVPLPDGAETVIDGLLAAIIAHWKTLGNTSISGLQTTFIQREGLLSFTPKHWQLNIIPGTFDMLLDQLPWSFQTIKYPWMDKPLFVSWR